MKILVAGALTVALPLLISATAAASTVSVQEIPGDTNRALLTYQAGAGEDNHLTITAGDMSGDYWQLHIVDTGAAITAGAGCTGGSGTEADCRMHRPKWFDFGPCSGHDCLPPQIPGTAWSAGWTIALSDGSNYFDGSAFTGTYSGSIAMKVSGGDGEDQISTGSGSDTIDPGAGSDVVHSGDGSDQIEATARPDAADTYESGISTDSLSYALRTVPVELQGSTGGAAGENDLLVGYFNVTGGAADDVLVGAPSDYILAGGPGNDTLVGSAQDSNELLGGPGDDRLSSVSAGAESINHMIGEEGNDSFYGGPGTDMMWDSTGSAAGYGPIVGPSGGNDVAYGEEGRDYIELREGDDLAYGGPDNDGLHGGTGEDRLFGGSGEDFVIGGSGYDRLFGGNEHDLLFSGWWTWNFPSPKMTFPFATVHNDGPDRVSCGSGRDRAFSNPRDRLLGCESKHLRPHRKLRGRR